MSACRPFAARLVTAVAAAWLAVAPAAAKEPTSVLLTVSPAPGRMYESVRLEARVLGILFDTSGPGKVDGGYEHSCAVTAAGGVMCWGANNSGQLGDGTNTDRVWPVAVAGVGGTGPLVGATAVATGAYHSCALLADATIVCWGRNVEGQLGVATPDTVQPTPMKVAGLAGVVAIAAGSNHSCAVLGDGTVRCWGENNDGELGRGVAGGGGPTPGAVVGPDGSGLAQLGGVTAVAAGGDHTCALGAGGSVHCWGCNGYGQVGTGTASAVDVTTPVAVVGGNIAAPLVGAVSIDVGHTHSCAAVAGGPVVCWGDNGLGQLGDGTTDDRPFPAAVKGIGGMDALTGAVEVALGDSYSCARTAAGEVRCWGEGEAGKLGHGSVHTLNPLPMAVTGLGAAAVDLAAGDDHACAVSADGELHCWGHGWSGQLGDGRTIFSPSPGPVTGGGQEAVSAGGSITCAVASGGVHCWGADQYGQLGDGAAGPGGSPVVTAGPGLPGNLTGAMEVAVGGFHVCARMADGGVKCWGSNETGQLGDGSGKANSSAPVNVTLDGTASAVVAGKYHACAIVSGGVRCWGRNTDGQLGNGDGTMTFSNTPLQVQGLLGPVIALAAGDFHTCALVQGASMRVYCWGLNTDGQLGIDPAVSPKLLSPSLPAMDGANEDPVAIAAGARHSCAVDDLGNLQCWGWNGFGQLGDGTRVSRHQRKVVVGVNGASKLLDVVAVDAGHGHTCARRSSGAMYCWGSNAYAQLGNGDTKSSLHPVVVFGSYGVELITTAISAGESRTCALTGGSVVQCWGFGHQYGLGGAVGFASAPVTAGRVPTGTVTFTIGGKAIDAYLRGGVATLSAPLPANLYRIAAAFPGDDVFEAATSAAVDLLVTGTPDMDWIVGTRAADTLVGGLGNDMIRGGRGGDVIDGGPGNDRIEGGPGRDRLTGGAGKDVFVFRKPSDSRPKTPDVITDFRKGDRIDVSAFANAADVRFRRKGSRLEVDRNGDGKPEFAVVLKGVKRLPKGAVKAKK